MHRIQDTAMMFSLRLYRRFTIYREIAKRIDLNVDRTTYTDDQELMRIGSYFTMTSIRDWLDGR